MLRRAWSLFCVVLAMCAAPAALARECISTIDLPVSSDAASLEAAIGRTTGDRSGRVVIPVSVNGTGPHRFIVDTGANRSVLSQDLANALGLTPEGEGVVHSVHDVTPAPLVGVQSLQYGPVSLQSRPMPVLQGPMLAGQDGLLGVDGMAGRRLLLDFRRRCIEIAPSSRTYRLTTGWTSVRGTLRFGHLVVLPGRIGSTRVHVLVDTGSDVTLANPALRQSLRTRAASLTDALETARAYSAGAPIVLSDVVGLPELELGDLAIRDLVAYVGDFHIFNLWGLQDEPTLLIGMDALRRTRAVAIDYHRAIISFRLNGAPDYVRMGTQSSRIER